MNLRNQRGSKNEQVLYEQAITSLKELNDEVFLNRFREEIQELLVSIQAEVNDLSDAIKKEKSFIQSAVEGMGQSVKKVNNESISNSQEVKQSIQASFQNFSTEYSNGIEHIKDSINRSNEYSRDLVDSYVGKYELQLQQSSERQKEAYDRLKKVSDNLNDYISKLEGLHTRWLETLFEFKAGMADRFTTIEHNIERQRKLIGETEERLLNQVNQIEGMIMQATNKQRLSAETYEEKWHSSLDEQKNLFQKVEVQLIERINSMENAITLLTNERGGWETVIDHQKTIWKNELIERAEIDSLNRTQLLEELKSANELLALQNLQELQTENNQLNVRQETLAKQNRLFMSGLVVLSALQIILYFI